MSDVVVQQQVALAPHTTLHIGGPARYFVVATTCEDIQAAASFAVQKKLPLCIIGGGSNILFSDDGYAGVVIKIAILGRRYETTAAGTVSVEVGAGENFDEFVADTVAKGYWGLENLSAIPGTVGATPIQNVGAYGVEAGDYIERVHVIDTRTGEESALTKSECQFGYRDSIFKHDAGKHLVVTKVTFCLSVRPQPKLQYRDLALHFGDKIPSLYEIRTAVRDIRSKKFPDWHVIGTAGSFFKNPIVPADVATSLRDTYPDLPMFPSPLDATVKVSLGYILDKICNLKGVRQGKVGLYESQALVLVAERGATARDVTTFASWVSARVEEKTGISIEPEVNFIS